MKKFIVRLLTLTVACVLLFSVAAMPVDVAAAYLPPTASLSDQYNKMTGHPDNEEIAFDYDGSLPNSVNNYIYIYAPDGSTYYTFMENSVLNTAIGRVDQDKLDNGFSGIAYLLNRSWLDTLELGVYELVYSFAVPAMFSSSTGTTTGESGSLYFTVRDSTIDLSGGLPDGTVGEAYSATLTIELADEVYGAPGPCTLEIVTGYNLPDGLALYATSNLKEFVVMGTPTTAVVNHAIDLVATDGDGIESTFNHTVTIRPAEAEEENPPELNHPETNPPTEEEQNKGRVRVGEDWYGVPTPIEGLPDYFVFNEAEGEITWNPTPVRGRWIFEPSFLEGTFTDGSVATFKPLKSGITFVTYYSLEYEWKTVPITIVLPEENE